MIRLHFCLPTSIIGKIITKLTWSDVSHVAIEIDGHVYESDHNTGVTKTSLKDWNKISQNTYELYAVNTTIIKDRLEKQLGAPYDWTALLTYPFRLDWTHKEKWTCSELIAWALQEYIPHNNYNRMAPRHLKLLGHALEQNEKRLTWL